MTPRNTKQGASANARRASSPGGTRAAPSARTPSSSSKRPVRATSKASLGVAGKKSAPKAPARPKKASRPSQPSSWRWWLLPILVITIAGVFVVTYYPVAKVQYRETRERARLRAELEGVRARNARLGSQVARLKTPEGVEDYARVQLGLVKVGEHVGVVVDDSASIPETIAVPSALRLDSEEAVVPPIGPWTAFLDSVFGNE
jgi:cell division protein FtsB